MEEWTSQIVNSALIILITVITLILVQLAARHFHKYIVSIEGIRKERRRQSITLIQILTWIISVTVVCVGLLMILSEFGVDITPLLASAGIAGLAVSLGAQTLIKDFIGGFLILFENQFVVGDDILLDTISGEVEKVTLRATYLRDYKGFQYIIPNGEIRIVANLNKEWSHALVDVKIGYEEDLSRVIGVLDQAAESFVKNPDYLSEIIGDPRVVGPVASSEWAVTMRVLVKIKSDRRLEISREFQKYILDACKKAGISQPYPRQDSMIISG